MTTTDNLFNEENSDVLKRMEVESEGVLRKMGQRNLEPGVMSVNNSFPIRKSFFENSSFGANWQLDNRYTSQEPGIEDEPYSPSPEKPQLFFPENYQRQAVFHGDMKAIEFWKDSLAISSKTVAAFILIKRNVKIEDYSGTSKDLKGTFNFSAAAMDKLIGARLGTDITKLEITDKDLQQLTAYLLDWLFKGDEVAKAAYMQPLFNFVRSEYNDARKDYLTFCEKLLALLAEILGPLADVCRQFMYALLKWLSDLIKKLLITNRRYWVKGHKSDKGEDDYLPVFFPVYSLMSPVKALPEIKKSFDKLDSVISKFFGSNHTNIPISNQKVEKQRSGIIDAMEFFYRETRQVLREFYDVLYNLLLQLDEVIAQVNALMVGVYNGLINFVVGIVDGLMILFEEGGFQKIIDGIKSLIEQIKEKGFITFIVETCKKIFQHFKEHYEHLDSGYDVLKTMGEDLVEIILNVIMAWETGVALFKKLEQFFTKILEVIKNPKALLEDIKEILSSEKKKLGDEPILKKRRFEEFKSKWEGKSIQGISKIEIVEGLIGYTEQANRIAGLIEKELMKIYIFEDTQFEKILTDAKWYTPKEAAEFSAFCIDDITCFRATTPPDVFLSEIVHEGTHVLDNLKMIKKSMYELEKRAYFHERAFQQAIGMEKDFESIQEMLTHIKTKY